MNAVCGGEGKQSVNNSLQKGRILTKRSKAPNKEAEKIRLLKMRPLQSNFFSIYLTP